MSSLVPSDQRRSELNIAATIHSASGEKTCATIVRLWYDGCEAATELSFEANEPVKIELGMMGCIRAHAASSVEGAILFRFDEECPV
jgi:hypothetical protein